MRNNGYLGAMNHGELVLAPDDFFNKLVWHSIPKWGIDEDHFEEDLLNIEEGYKTLEEVAITWKIYIVTLKFIMKKMWIH